MKVRISLVITLILVGLAISSFPVLAQGGDGGACSPEALAITLHLVDGLVAQARAAASDSDLKTALGLVDEAHTLLGQAQDDCAAALAVPALCDAFPTVCVPRTGGGDIVTGYPNETPDLRALDGDSAGVPGVVRGVTPDGAFFIGDPEAPVQFVEFADFACPHCIDYHNEMLGDFMEQAVLTGKATFEVRLMAFVAGDLSFNAAQAMLCAGEQGAAWEMQEDLYRRVTESGNSAFAVPAITAAAEGFGLDGDALAACIESDRYLPVIDAYHTFASDNGVTGTPTVLVRYGDEEWTHVEDRSLDGLLALIEAAP